MAVKIPNRVGEALAGIDRASSSNQASLADVLNQAAVNLAAIKTASQLADFAAFKVAMATLDVLVKSDDSRI